MHFCVIVAVTTVAGMPIHQKSIYESFFSRDEQVAREELNSFLENILRLSKVENPEEEFSEIFR